MWRLLLNGYNEQLTGQSPVLAASEDSLLAFRQSQTSRPWLEALLKRTLDLTLALLFLPIALPAMALCALAIRLDSPGTVFFVQERLGWHGTPFRLMKFRTMVADAEKDGPQWCRDGDPRITRVGGFLRKLRLDELPQLFNVLKNDMSLVGPRPIRQHFTDLLEREIPGYRLRLAAKPGLTGWAQVHLGHANTVADHALTLQYDLFYLRHRSLALDCLILFMTMGVVLKGKGR